ncbi:LysR family transcriptional regulator [uncultured Thomasclavelia sp.]|uniref:LysR family transcriptional regulator n=1 Tax=uncultured Thomasclavelia sp. TaxID=3025759 RepID=UPI0025CD97E8|nr:LysR family transcriptional regulator [uncultured Thomasclavelia sp.]
MLDFRIDTFLAVCKFMNFTKASQYLNITQPAVSGHIKYLEEYYQVKLFVYSGKKMQLTKEGKILLEVATTLKHDDIFLKKKLKNQSQKQELIFGATLSVGEYIMPRIINSLLQENCNLAIKMKVANTSELLQGINEGKLDFAIVEGYFNKNEYDYRTFCYEDYICVGANDLKIDNLVDISSLFKFNLIIRERGSGSREIIARWLKERNLDLTDFDKVIEIGNINTIKQLVANLQGITFIYQMAVTNEINQGILKQIKINDLQIRHEINFIWRKNSVFSDYYQQLFELLQLQNKKVLL